MRKCRGWTVVEALVVVALVALGLGLVTLEVAGVRPAGERLTRHQQQRALQEALDQWAAAAPSLAAARQAFNGSKPIVVPADQWVFLRDQLGPFLRPGSLADWIEFSNEEQLQTRLWATAQEALVIRWGPDWRRQPPQVVRISLEEET